MKEGSENGANHLPEWLSEPGETEEVKTGEKKETKLPEGITYVDGGTFEAWFAPGMSISPKTETFPYREGVPLLAEKYKDLFDEWQEAQKKEVEFTQRGLGLTLGRLGHVKQLETFSAEFLYKSLQAARGKSVSMPSYIDVRDRVLDIVDEAKVTLQKDRKNYAKGIIETTKVSLRNIEFVAGEDGSPVMECEYARVPYTAYQVIRDPDLPQEVLDLANPTATAIIIRTAERPDEPPSLAIQVRSKYNRLYAKAPGASAAGMWDARKESGKTVLPTIEEAMSNATKEMAEEVGLTPEHIEKIGATGFTIDKRSYHSELTFLADLNVSAKEMINISKAADIESGQFYGFDFSESWVFVRSDLESLEKFLTQARLHTPSTHAAAIMAVAVATKREQLMDDGLENGEVSRQMTEYVNGLQTRVKENYKKVDNIVKDHWQEKIRLDSKLTPKNPNGYDPELPPEAQGLPSVNEELKHLGLITIDMEKTTREFDYPKEPKYAWMMDVDGVITDPSEKTADPEVIRGMIGKLSTGEPVVLNTGRSLEFVKESVLKIIEEQIPDKKMLRGVCIVGEKGGSYGFYNDEGSWEEHINESLKGIGFELIQDEARSICEESDGFLIFDDTKQTMVTLEMRDGGNLEDFAKVQGSYVERLKARLRDLGMEKSHLVDPSTIAIDIQSTALGGKADAARLLSDLLEQKGINPKEFICLGDSSSDTEMRRGLEENGIFAKYVDVGKAELTREGGLMTIHTEEKYTSGAAGVLTSNPTLL